ADVLLTEVPMNAGAPVPTPAFLKRRAHEETEPTILYRMGRLRPTLTRMEAAARHAQAPTDDSGMWVVTSNAGAGLRLLDFERGRVVWQDRHPGNGMPMFSSDGRFVSIPFKTSREA